MPRNVEIKARVSDPEQLKSVAMALGGGEGTIIVQEDTFFNSPNGRLKLREIKGSKSQLIQYSRADEGGPKLSDFYISEVDDAESMKTVLGKSMGVKGVVSKTRTLVMVGQTRVHIDDVVGLGHFMELEVMLRDDQSLEEGQNIADDLMKKLNIQPSDLVTGAYMDMLVKDK